MIDKDIELLTPTSLYDLNIASSMVFMKSMKIENLDPMDKVMQIIANINNLPIDDVRALPMDVIDENGTLLLNLFQSDDREYTLDDVRHISIEGNDYALEPNFGKIETGAYIDITNLLEDIDNNLHKVMAILYRPIKERKGSLYNLTPYSTEPDISVDARAELFLTKMPYAIVRATIGFMLKTIKR